MEISELIKLYSLSPACQGFRRLLADKKTKRAQLNGITVPSALAMIMASCAAGGKAKEMPSVIMTIMNDADEAGYMYHDLTQILGNESVLFFPSSYKRKVKYGQKDAANEILRTEVLAKLSLSPPPVFGQAPPLPVMGEGVKNVSALEGVQKVSALEDFKTVSVLEGNFTPSPITGRGGACPKTGGGERPLFIVSYPEALAEMVVSKKLLDERTIVLSNGMEMQISALGKQLQELGFHEVDYVYEPGQYAQRGSIMDVYSFSSEYPFRVDFFGDEIDSLRTFEIESQLSKDRKEQITIVPEMAGTKTERINLLSFLPEDAVLIIKDYLFTRDIINNVYEEGFASKALSERLETATEMERAEILEQLNRENILTSAQAFTRAAQQFRIFSLSPPPVFGQAPPLPIMGEGVKSPSSAETVLKSSSAETFLTPSSAETFYTPSPITGRGGAGEKPAGERGFSPQPLFHKNFDLLFAELKKYLSYGYKLYILADSAKQQERLMEIFEPQNISFIPISKTIHAGFIDNAARICLFTDHQIFDRFHRYNLKSDTTRRGKVALTMKELQEMEVGDYVIHVDLGVGKFAGLMRIPLPSPKGEGQGESYREVIRIVYQNNDMVDVSIHSLYKISKYKRGDSEQPPRLSTLGTGAWERLKERTKKRIKDIARDLIKLYAARRHEKGFAFSGDSFMQHELEASFLYEDTPDQLKATNDVKADMESPRPMDRLVCGDVGFGKTEVAMRAAFKACCDSKQVAVLVPTTVLAYQHFQSFKSRMKGMPVRVDYLSRARSAKQTKEVLADLAAGKIDIIIGTHKLISKSVKFKDLGLLIIDEEQKFGVSTKEKLRQMKTNIDTLTMSATPIPRTLQFSLMGARDMSIIQTPPPNRYPVTTEIHTFDKDVIIEAINYEMSRNGQVYFVNNRIGNLEELKMMIEKYIPDCRVAIGHGQMKPELLEKTVMGFINYDYDVLISTTIVENGIDVGNANTIIINGAHHFGLSDLHQMRGRVGRSNKKAFCYLIAPPLAALNTDARRRLEALETFSELGSGFNLSMQDLDIRGAGNLLGAEQSGFMEDLGYETYMKILNQAVKELKRESPSPLPSPPNGGEGDKYVSAQKEVTGKFTGSTAKHTNFAPSPPKGEEGRGEGPDFVEDCSLESDLEMFFPDRYVPGSSERMILYRELDRVKNDRDLEEYRRRLEDRFGPLPQPAEELLQVSPLRRLGMSLGCEKIILKGGQMRMQFVSDDLSPFYRSETFGNILTYVTRNARRCNFKDVHGKRLMIVSGVNSVKEAVDILNKI